MKKLVNKYRNENFFYDDRIMVLLMFDWIIGTDVEISVLRNSFFEQLLKNVELLFVLIFDFNMNSNEGRKITF